VQKGSGVDCKVGASNGSGPRLDSVGKRGGLDGRLARLLGTLEEDVCAKAGGIGGHNCTRGRGIKGQRKSVYHSCVCSKMGYP